MGLRGHPRATKDADFIVDAPAFSFPGLPERLVAEGEDERNQWLEAALNRYGVQATK